MPLVLARQVLSFCTVIVVVRMLAGAWRFCARVTPQPATETPAPPSYRAASAGPAIASGGALVGRERIRTAASPWTTPGSKEGKTWVATTEKMFSGCACFGLATPIATAYSAGLEKDPVSTSSAQWAAVSTTRGATTVPVQAKPLCSLPASM